MSKGLQTSFTSAGAQFLAGMTKIQADARKITSAGPRARYRDKNLVWRVVVGPVAEKELSDIPTTTLLEDTSKALYKLLVLIGTRAADLDLGIELDLTILSTWKTWIGTLAHCVFPEPTDGGEIITGRRDIPPDLALDIYQWGVALKTIGGSFNREGSKAIPEADLLQFETDTNALIDKLSLPQIEDMKNTDIFDLRVAGSPLSQAAYYALVVFLAGRPVSARTTSIDVNRPKNLQDKYNKGKEWKEIGGPMKMRSYAWRNIGQVWDLDSAFRHGYFTPLIGLTTSGQGMVEDVIATMVVLLQYSQLSHVKIILDLLDRYPWIAEMPEFSREMHILSAGVELLKSYPPDRRPYMKLLMRDLLKAFDSKLLVRLIVFAVDVLSGTETSLRDYALKGGDPALIERFNAIRAEREGREAARLAGAEYQPEEEE